MALGAIFYQIKVMLFSNCHDLIHFAAGAVKMDHQNGFGLFGYFFFNFISINTMKSVRLHKTGVASLMVMPIK